MENVTEARINFMFIFFYIGIPEYFKFHEYPFKSMSDKQRRQFERRVKWFTTLEVLSKTKNKTTKHYFGKIKQIWKCQFQSNIRRYEWSGNNYFL